MMTEPVDCSPHIGPEHKHHNNSLSLLISRNAEPSLVGMESHDQQIQTTVSISELLTGQQLLHTLRLLTAHEYL